MFSTTTKISDDTKATCEKYNDLTTIEDMMIFVNATWYCPVFDSSCIYYQIV